MKVLAIDTSSKLCSVAILEDTNLIKKLELDNGLTHSETLMPLIKELLEVSNLSLKENPKTANFSLIYIISILVKKLKSLKFNSFSKLRICIDFNFFNNSSDKFNFSNPM